MNGFFTKSIANCFHLNYCELVRQLQTTAKLNAIELNTFHYRRAYPLLFERRMWDSLLFHWYGGMSNNVASIKFSILAWRTGKLNRLKETIL